LTWLAAGEPSLNVLSSWQLHVNCSGGSLQNFTGMRQANNAKTTVHGHAPAHASAYCTLAAASCQTKNV